MDDNNNNRGTLHALLLGGILGGCGIAAAMVLGSSITASAGIVAKPLDRGVDTADNFLKGPTLQQAADGLTQLGRASTSIANTYSTPWLQRLFFRR